MTQITLTNDSERVDHWTSLELFRSIEDAAWSLDLETIDKWTPRRQKIGIERWDKVELRLDDSLVFTGHVFTTDLSYEANVSHGFAVGARSLTAGIVDCSTPAKTWRGKSIQAIAREVLHPFGIQFRVDSTATVGAGQTFSEIAAEDGETVYDLLVRLTRYRGILLTVDEKGGVVFTTASQKPVPGVVIKPTAANLARDVSDRFSDYTCKAQLPAADLETVEPVTVKGTANDPGVPLHRPITIMPDGHETRSGLTRRAQWERAVRVGKSAELHYEVKGWTAKTGRLWTPGDLIPVNDPLMGVSLDLLLAEVTLSLSENAETASLTLKHPSAYIAEKVPTPKKKKDDSLF